MSWTTPRTWTDTEVVTAAIMNTHVRDDFAYLYPVIYDVTLGSDQANIDTLAIIPNTYRHLRVVADLRSTTAGVSLVNANMRMNNDSGANYDWAYSAGSAATMSASQTQAATSAFIGNCPSDGAPAGYFSTHDIAIGHYASTSGVYKAWNLSSSVFISQAAGGSQCILMQGNWRSTSVLTRIQIVLASGNVKAGSRLRVYGTF